MPIFDRRHIIKEQKRALRYNFAGYKLPLPSTMDYRYFGKILIENDNVVVIKSSSPIDGYTFRITRLGDCNIIQILPKNCNYNLIDIVRNNITTVLVVTDYPSGKDPSTFRREVDNIIYHFKDSELYVETQSRRTPFIKPIRKNRKLIKNRLMTLDVETTSEDVLDEKTGKMFTVMKVYLVSVYDGKKATSFYIDDYKNEIELINSVISFLLSGPYNNRVIYTHNLAKFDSVFLLRYLATSKDCYMDKPLMKDGRFIQITIKVGIDGGYSLKFVDSLQLLPQSLKSLAKQFNVEEKGLFPVLMPIPDNSLSDKVGFFPDFKFFNNVSYYDYEQFKSNFDGPWVFRDESIKYCEQDCITLYQVLSNFNKLIFERFKKNIWDYPTLPSLALAIFRSNYLEENKIPQLRGLISDFIRDGFTGGSTDMFIPYSKKPIYVYDVNSLYPYIMAMFDMPIGKIEFFKGDITKIDPKAFGFFEVEVTAPKNLKIPILQTHVKTPGGTRTISPLGSWTGVYFSEEIYNARDNFGYKFKILRGYTFERGKIFDGYINNLYEIKLNSSKLEALYLISKLLMNSLFGRFSMDYDLAETAVITQALFDELSKGKVSIKRSRKKNFEVTKNEVTADGMPIQVKQLITDFINFGDEMHMVTIENMFDPENDEQVEHFFSSAIVSIAISAAITAYARIHMSQFKKPGLPYKLYYSDTDSIMIDKPLGSSFIGKELGKMKLEYVFEESIFLASKVYGGHIQGENRDICKVKGFKNKVSISELKNLLSKDSKISLSHEKWFRNFAAGNIQIKEQPYVLRVTDNKRKLVFKNNILVKTEPYIINNNKEILNK